MNNNLIISTPVAENYSDYKRKEFYLKAMNSMKLLDKLAINDSSINAKFNNAGVLNITSGIFI